MTAKRQSPGGKDRASNADLRSMLRKSGRPRKVQSEVVGEAAIARVLEPPTLADEWDAIWIDISALAPLLRTIERNLEALDCTHPLADELTSGDVSLLAGLAHRRLASLAERMSARRADLDG